ncbi:MAG TPA: PadR family transcriptional regulator [Rhizomicrobium sp.]|nr:PadR family transcriptional regulator [Rhizomicrobium sp.]
MEDPAIAASRGSGHHEPSHPGGPEPLPESIQIQLKKGVLEMCVLTRLARGDSYGYEIFSRLLAQIGMGEGTIYPLMRRMQADGLVTTYLAESSGGGAPRKYYKITEQGRAALVAQRAEWTDFRSAVDAILAEEP